jgi:hypothetical protein
MYLVHITPHPLTSSSEHSIVDAQRYQPLSYGLVAAISLLRTPQLRINSYNLFPDSYPQSELV